MISNVCLYFKVIVLVRIISLLIFYCFLVMENEGGRFEIIWKFLSFRIIKFDLEIYVEVIVWVENVGIY